MGSRDIAQPFFLTLTLDGMVGERDAPATLTPEKGPGTHRTGGWLGPRVGLDWNEIFRPHHISKSGPYST